MKELVEKQKSPVSIPKGFVTKCKACQRPVFQEELVRNLNVCPKCGFHMRISARERIRQVADTGSFVERYANLRSENPIAFLGYDKKLADAKEKTGEEDGLIAGAAKICNIPVLLGVMDSNFMMASMGSVTGEKVTKLFEDGVRERLPVILFTASGGARMQEGIFSLMQMAKTSGAQKRFSEAGGFYLTVLTDPTTGGVSASFAMLGDVILAEKGALVCFAGPRVIEGTIGDALPEGFQSAEFLLKKGFVDRVVTRAELRETIDFLLSLHTVKEEAEVTEHV